MIKWIISAALLSASISLIGNTSSNHQEITMEHMNLPPKHLYKILSLRNWQDTQGSKTVQLSTEDDVFIHLSTEDQLQRIIEKYWADTSELVILKIDSSKLQGELRLEANPGGTNKYYHLYNGLIPFSSIREAKIIYPHKN